MKTQEEAQKLIDTKYKSLVNMTVTHIDPHQILKIQFIIAKEGNNKIYEVEFTFYTTFINNKGDNGRSCNHLYFDTMFANQNV